MENIIKKAIEGGFAKHLPNIEDGLTAYRRYVLDSNFWECLGKACKWEGKEIIDTDGDTGIMSGWLYYAMEFHNKNLTENWYKAVKYLEDLITN